MPTVYKVHCFSFIYAIVIVFITAAPFQAVTLIFAFTFLPALITCTVSGVMYLFKYKYTVLSRGITATLLTLICLPYSVLLTLNYIGTFIG